MHGETTFAYPSTHGWIFALFLPFDHCERCRCNIHVRASEFLFFQFFGAKTRSGIAGSRRSSMFTFSRSGRAVFHGSYGLPAFSPLKSKRRATDAVGEGEALGPGAFGVSPDSVVYPSEPAPASFLPPVSVRFPVP